MAASGDRRCASRRARGPQPGRPPASMAALHALSGDRGPASLMPGRASEPGANPEAPRGPHAASLWSVPKSSTSLGRRGSGTCDPRGATGPPRRESHGRARRSPGRLAGKCREARIGSGGCGSLARSLPRCVGRTPDGRGRPPSSRDTAEARGAIESKQFYPASARIQDRVKLSQRHGASSFRHSRPTTNHNRSA
jgi:hypothetical protein